MRTQLPCVGVRVGTVVGASVGTVLGTGEGFGVGTVVGALVGFKGVVDPGGQYAPIGFIVIVSMSVIV